MRASLIPVLIVPLLITACTTRFEYKAPDIKPPPDIQLPTGKGGELPPEFFVCDKTDQNITEAHKQNAMQVYGSSDFQDVESNCAGTKTLTPKMPLNTFKAELKLDPPENLRSKVSFAIISNARTCAERRVVQSDQVQQDKTLFAAHPYELDHSGSLKVGLNNDTIRLMSIGLNVAAGQNLITVTYYGRCLSGQDAPNCEKGEELARNTVLVIANISRHELDGVKKFDTCIDPKKK